ncbi:veswaprin-c-like [Ahaetulla prasina]|uniref:veswaprin-c-like n=1 Tax=Ahaetulla prasina TaxID=499056 RepID=UPI0026476741|nr:veswaprin-c-like [Ahaetulla prasina]
MGSGGIRAILLGLLVLSARLTPTGARGKALVGISARHQKSSLGTPEGDSGHGKHGICITQCQSDADCVGGRRCCPTGCGFVCRAQCRGVPDTLPGRRSGSQDDRSWIQPKVKT